MNYDMYKPPATRKPKVPQVIAQTNRDSNLLRYVLCTGWIRQRVHFYVKTITLWRLEKFWVLVDWFLWYFQILFIAAFCTPRVDRAVFNGCPIVTRTTPLARSDCFCRRRPLTKYFSVTCFRSKTEYYRRLVSSVVFNFKTLPPTWLLTNIWRGFNRIVAYLVLAAATLVRIRWNLLKPVQQNCYWIACKLFFRISTSNVTNIV